MANKNKIWGKLFLFSLGLFISSAFCMKWMESDFLFNGNLFTIIGLEITYPKEKVITILTGIDPFVRSVLKYHLSFDFIFMLGVYPGIASLCMMARERIMNKIISNILLAAAFLQIVAFGCDIIENIYLLNWLDKPEIGSEFLFYHLVVEIKWVLAISAAAIAIPLSIKMGIRKEQ